MCGIAGIYTQHSSVGPEFIERMTNALRHRGPDDEGYLAAWIPEKNVHHLSGRDSQISVPRIFDFSSRANLYLGHRRLSILDLSAAGHQPMTNHDKSLWLVFNGEIYNYSELRRELQQRGFVFKTNTDSEVLLAGYEAWGQELPARLNGMWAYVILDLNRNLLTGSRDCFGVKPLYYAHIDGNFSFASEMKALLTLPWVSRKVNHRSVAHYLLHGLDQIPGLGFFEDVQELQPGHQFEIDLTSGALSVRRFFHLCWNHDSPKFSETELREWVGRVREKTISAVRRHLISDVPVGSCLSGGIDSSSIVGVISHLLKGENLQQVGARQKVLTACYEGDRIDESHWAEKAALAANAEWLRVSPKEQELVLDLEDLVFTQEVPFVSMSIYSQYRVMKLAREHGLKVLLDGQGGDEIFTGYPPYYKVFWAELLVHGHWAEIRREWQHLATAQASPWSLAKGLAEYWGGRMLPKSLVERMRYAKLPRFPWVSSELYEISASDDRIDRPVENLLNSELAHLMMGGNLQSLLRYEDRNAMRFSIESRTPFADDRELIELAFHIPGIYKIHRGWSKYLLRQSMKDFLPPDIYTRRDKIGFATPDAEWLQTNSQVMKEYLAGCTFRFFDGPALGKEWDALVRSSNRLVPSFLWRCLNLAVWQKVFGLA